MPTKKQKLVLDYIKRFPKYPKKALARKIFADHKLEFGTFNAAYMCLRTMTGTNGAAQRKRIEKKGLLMKMQTFTQSNPFDLPDSDYEAVQSFTIPTTITKLGILSDIHIPEHDMQALTVAIRELKTSNINGLLLNGDILDMHAVSRHFKDPSKARVKKEFELGRAFIEAIKKHFPDMPIYFKEGNHEKRWTAWLRTRALEIWDDDEYTIPNKLKLGEHHITWIPNNQPIKYGDLWIIHGNEITGNSRVSPAHAVSLKTHEATLTGDKHRGDRRIVKHQLSGKLDIYYTTGCLCGLRADYMPNNDWVHGFAIAYVNSQGNINVDNKDIMDGQII